MQGWARTSLCLLAMSSVCPFVPRHVCGPRVWQCAHRSMSTSVPAPHNCDTHMRNRYDAVISCPGWLFDDGPFVEEGTRPALAPNGKHPATTARYESDTVPGLYFAGTLAHGLDAKKSSGGFIHGFRYTARALHRVLEEEEAEIVAAAQAARAGEPVLAEVGVAADGGVDAALSADLPQAGPSPPLPWPRTPVAGLRRLVATLLRRVNVASGIYQMFGALADVVLLRPLSTKVGLLGGICSVHMHSGLVGAYGQGCVCMGELSTRVAGVLVLRSCHRGRHWHTSSFPCEQFVLMSPHDLDGRLPHALYPAALLPPCTSRGVSTTMLLHGTAVGTLCWRLCGLHNGPDRTTFHPHLLQWCDGFIGAMSPCLHLAFPHPSHPSLHRFNMASLPTCGSARCPSRPAPHMRHQHALLSCQFVACVLCMVWCRLHLRPRWTPLCPATCSRRSQWGLRPTGLADGTTLSVMHWQWHSLTLSNTTQHVAACEGVAPPTPPSTSHCRWSLGRQGPHPPPPRTSQPHPEPSRRH